MAGGMVVQGRELSAGDIGQIQGLLAEHPGWGRTRLSEELCRRWDWRNARGRIKDMAARALLLKLERAGHLRLPQRRRKSTNGLRNRNAPLVAHATAPICCALRELRPLALSVVDPNSEDLRLFNCLLSRYHYLGHRNTVGENIRYLVRDRAGRPVGCALFGSAAWKCAARDAWIGWDRGRFRGACYQAANWVRLGPTQGRTRNDRERSIRTSVKDVYLYPLIKDFRRELCAC